mgnify:CR=1 FL=1
MSNIDEFNVIIEKDITIFSTSNDKYIEFGPYDKQKDFWKIDILKTYKKQGYLIKEYDINNKIKLVMYKLKMQL